jgi:hypothetical protein
MQDTPYPALLAGLRRFRWLPRRTMTWALIVGTIVSRSRPVHG